MIRVTIALPAQEMPASTAMTLDQSLAPTAWKSTMSPNPAKARITASHSIPRICSSRIGQARRMTQNGMV